MTNEELLSLPDAYAIMREWEMVPPSEVPRLRRGDYRICEGNGEAHVHVLDKANRCERIVEVHPIVLMALATGTLDPVVFTSVIERSLSAYCN